MKRFGILFTIIICSVNLLTAQIINIESKRIATDTIGFSGKIGMSLSAAKFTQTFVAVELASHVQWKTKKNLYLLIGDLDIVNAGGESFNNSGFGHFRFNRRLTPKIKLEFFSQVQYNSVTKITARYINGAGLRFKLSPYDNAKVYWGFTAMYEYEELSDPVIINKDIRLSSYITFNLVPVKTITLNNTTYMQPLLEDFNDFRLSNSTRLNFVITQNLSFTTDFNFLYDSRPPEDIPSINYQVKNGLNYRFE